MTPPKKVEPERRRRVDAKKQLSDFETHLRGKIFKQQIKLLTSVSEPAWLVRPAAGANCLFPVAKAFSPHTLVSQGVFVAAREEAIRDALKEAEVGVGVEISGFGGELNTKGLLQFLKPYQWINMWRSVPREIYVPNGVTVPGVDGTTAGNPDTETLNRAEHELMSLGKYQDSESEFMTVITYSNDVNSGAVALFKATFGDNQTVTRLDLEAYFKDMPKEICRILSQSVKPNRYELKRTSGQKLICRMRGKLPAPRPAAVTQDEEAWGNIGGGWRRALHIILHDDYSYGEGLVATIPQMLAYLHLRYRLIDYVPSTPVFSFEPRLPGRRR
jgi:hypothetical protein